MNTFREGSTVDTFKEVSMDTFKQTRAGQERRQWEPPAVKAVGTLGAVLQNGTAKTSVRPGDPGEAMKNTVHE